MTLHISATTNCPDLSIDFIDVRLYSVYPFWVEPTSAGGGINVHYCYEKNQHQCGKPIRVKDWIRDNLDDEKRKMLNEEFRAITEIGSLIHKANERGVEPERIENLILCYRYLNYDTEQPFIMQFIRNNAAIITWLRRLIEERQ